MKKIWLEQRVKLQRLAESAGLSRQGKRGSLKDALYFAEMLVLIPNEAAVIRLMRDDEAAALSFLEVASKMTTAIETANPLPSTSGIKTPFHEFADFVLEFLNTIREEAPDKF
jgi:hypothetical protein